MNEPQITEDEEVNETVLPEEELPIFWEDLETIHRRLQNAIENGDLGGIQNAADDLRKSIWCSHLREGRIE